MLRAGRKTALIWIKKGGCRSLQRRVAIGLQDAWE